MTVGPTAAKLSSVLRVLGVTAHYWQIYFMQPDRKSVIQQPFIEKPILVWWCCQICSTKNRQEMTSGTKYSSCRDCGVLTKLVIK